MNPVRPALVRYVYFDVVDFSKGRSIEAQTEILISLNQTISQSVASIVDLSDQTIFLPTGDGVCVCLVNLIHPLDLDIRIALETLDRLCILKRSTVDLTRKYDVRVGLNENQDNLILDVRGSANVVGLGINMAQRIMSVAAPSRLMLGHTVFERLSQREAYRSWIRPAPAIVKHGQRLLCYEFFNPALLQRPALLILDEATSALDARTEAQVEAALKDLGCTQVVVAHRLSTIRDADEILVMDRGSVVQQGTHQALIEAEGSPYHKLLLLDNVPAKMESLEQGHGQ